MNIVCLTSDESLYLPRFFSQFLERRAGDVTAIFVTPPGHGKKKSAWTMARKYLAAFGFWNFLILASHVLAAKIKDKLGIGRTAGRYYSIESVAKAHGVPCEYVADVNSTAFMERLRNLETHLILSVSCPQIFRKPLIALPRQGCLNVHGALLPQYRGLLPSFWMMVKGEPLAGVTVFFVNEEIDAGDVIEVVKFDIDPDESLHRFIVRSKEIHCTAVLNAIRKIEDGDLKTTSLDTDGGSYYSWPDREAYREFRRRGRKLW